LCRLAAAVRSSARMIVIVGRTRKRAKALATDLRYGAPLVPRPRLSMGITMILGVRGW
jgi:L-lactate dehydrogenase